MRKKAGELERQLKQQKEAELTDVDDADVSEATRNNLRYEIATRYDTPLSQLRAIVNSSPDTHLPNSHRLNHDLHRRIS